MLYIKYITLNYKMFILYIPIISANSIISPNNVQINSNYIFNIYKIYSLYIKPTNIIHKLYS